MSVVHLAGIPSASRRTALKILGAAAVSTALARRATAAEPIKIGLSAAFSGPNATAGEALQRGADLAMEEINAAGGVLGRPLALVIR
ncbi:MAG: braC 2, partial [Rhodospirillales bacterium]|nr:braC 2 [Rhodospirillales bacterium]